MLAFEEFLQKYPHYKKQVSFTQIVVPSRHNVEKYKSLREEINMLVGRINSSFRTINWIPINYFYSSFPLPMLSAFYRMADIALITPMRDGMNLVSKEFVASKFDQKGVLILSEMAGASKELSDAILINPNDINQIAEAIHTALTLPEEEQIKNMQNMQQTLQKLNIFQWMKLFMDRLENIREVQKSLATKRLDEKTIECIYQKYYSAVNRLFFLDYDGTLAPFNKDPKSAGPDEALIALLKDLTGDTKNKVVLTSGRDKNTLDKWLGFLRVEMVAEHGVWVKHEGEDWKTMADLSHEWKERILSVMENYVIRTPGSFVEEKDFSLVWHYRRVEGGLAEIRTRELISHLKLLVSDLNLQVLEGDKVVEVKNAEVDKGRATLAFLKKYPHDFAMAIGDDLTDEDIFKVMPEDSVTIRVGSTTSVAKYSVNSSGKVRELLTKIAAPVDL